MFSTRQNYTRRGVSFIVLDVLSFITALKHTIVHFTHYPLSVITLFCIASRFSPAGHISVYIRLDHVPGVEKEGAILQVSGCGSSGLTWKLK